MNKLMSQDLDPKKVQEEINKAQQQKIDAHGEQITLMQTVSLGVIIALCLGLVSAIQGFNAMRREADQFKSQLFIDLIKQNIETNTKIDQLINNN